MRWIWMLVAAVLLSGCAAEETMETVADVWAEPVMVVRKELHLELPEGAASPVADTEGGQWYDCGSFSVGVLTLPAGDVNATVRTLSGFEKDALTVMETGGGGIDRYDFVWVTTGETGEMFHRALVLDDGNFHYCLTVSGDAQSAGETKDVWQTIFDSAYLE